MLKYYEGTVFNVPTQALVNTVNCTGVMGAGVALEFMLRYPAMFEDYVLKCKSNQIVTGKVSYFLHTDNTTIVNFPTKWHFKYPSRIEWIEQGLKNFVTTHKAHGITSVAFPKLGTSNGGLRWDEVRSIMEKHLSDLDIEVYICLDNLTHAEGLEKKMVEAFNNTCINQLSSVLKLNSKQVASIHEQMPFNRFWKIAECDSVGAKTYSVLFKHFYQIATGAHRGIQLKLFNDSQMLPE